MRLRSLVAIAALGLALVALGTGFVLASDHLDNKAAFLSLALTVGLSFLISGVIALWRRPDNRTGIYLVLVSYFWCLGGLAESSNDWIYTLGVLLNSFALGAFVQLLLAYPTGRLQGRRDMWLVIAAYGLVFVGSVGQLLVDPRPNPDCPDCMSTIAVTSSDTARTVVTGVVGVLALAAVVGVLTIVVTRFLRAKGALRRALGPVLGTGALVMGVLLVQLVVGVFSEDAAEPLYYLFFVTLVLVPVAFLAGVLRSRLARSGVGELLLELSQGTPIRDAIAHALRDPTLEIAYWLPDEGRYVSSGGRPLAAVLGGLRRAGRAGGRTPPLRGGGARARGDRVRAHLRQPGGRRGHDRLVDRSDLRRPWPRHERDLRRARHHRAAPARARARGRARFCEHRREHDPDLPRRRLGRRLGERLRPEPGLRAQPRLDARGHQRAQPARLRPPRGSLSRRNGDRLRRERRPLRAARVALAAQGRLDAHRLLERARDPRHGRADGRARLGCRRDAPVPAGRGDPRLARPHRAGGRRRAAAAGTQPARRRTAAARRAVAFPTARAGPARGESHGPPGGAGAISRPASRSAG